MASTLIPEQRKFIGVTLFLVGFLCLAMSGAILALIVSKRESSAQSFTESQNSCVQRLGALGGEVDEIPGRIIWIKKGIDQAPARLGEASVASVLCPGWRLRTACVGGQCPDKDAMRIVLEPMFNDPNDALLNQ